MESNSAARLPRTILPHPGILNNGFYASFYAAPRKNVKKKKKQKQKPGIKVQ